MAINKKTKRKRSKPKAKKRLLEQVVHLTGIPSQAIRKELQAIMANKNIRTEDITLDQLRSVAATYLREIMGGLLDSAHLRRHDRTNQYSD